MADRYLQLVLTPAVQQAQREFYGRHQDVASAEERTPLGPSEQEFIQSRDSFYMATVSETGWPYLQHRGGPAGFLRLLDPLTLGFADFKGNRQLLSTGNLSGNSRVSLFLMDYPRRERLKILGHARVLDAGKEPTLAARLAPETLAAKVERLFVIDVVSFDWNCPQYITPRFTAAEVEEAIAPLKARLAELERRLAEAPSPPRS